MSIQSEPIQFRDSILEISAEIFCETPIEKITLTSIAERVGVSKRTIADVFPSVLDIANQILDYERDTMRLAITKALQDGKTPLDCLKLAFLTVGRNISDLPKVRAGVRLASEARDYFPERRLDPFNTWQSFVKDQIIASQNQGIVRRDLDPEAITWLFVSAGIGIKELLKMQDKMNLIPQKFELVIPLIIETITT